MSRKQGNPFADHEFLRAANEQKEAMENECDVVVTATIGLRRSPCVLVIHLEARSRRAPEADWKLAGYEVEWPNAGTMSWSAQVFNAYVRLARMVEETRLYQEAELAFRAV